MLPFEHVMPAGLSPWSKLMHAKDPIEHYEQAKVYGTEYKFWSDPWKNWFRPAVTTLQRYWLGDKSIPAHVQDVRDTQQFFDVLKWYKYQRLALQADEAGVSNRAAEYRQVAQSTKFGVNPFGGESTIKYALPYSERPYFQAFSGAISPAAQGQIQDIVPQDEQALLQGVWQNRLRMALSNKQMQGTISSDETTQLAQLQTVAATEGKPYSEDLYAEYVNKSQHNMSYADWYRMKEAEAFLSQYKLPGPSWVGWCIPSDQVIISDNYELKTADTISVNDKIYQGLVKNNLVSDIFTRDIAEEIITIKVAPDNYHQMSATKNHNILVAQPHKCRYRRVSGYGINDRCVPRINKICTDCKYKSYTFDLRFVSIDRVRVNDYLAQRRMEFSNKETIIDIKDIASDHPRFKFNDSLVWTYYKDPRNAISRFLRIDSDICWLLGYYAAEGNLRYRDGQPRGFQFTQSISEDILLNKLIGILTKLNLPYFISVRKREGNEAREIIVNSPLFAKLIESYIPGKCDTKYLSRLDILASKQHASAFIVGLFAGDGSKTEDSRSVLAITSYRLALQAKELLAAIGINHSFRKLKKQSNRKQKYATTLFFGAATVALEKGIRGFSNGYISKKSSLSCFFTEDYVLYKISNIDIGEYSGSVYDYSICKLHEYRCPIGTYHNSPSTDLEDIKLKQIMAEGKSHYDFDIFTSRVRTIQRKPYLDSNYTREDFALAEREDNPQNPYYTQRLLRNILSMRGIHDASINYGLNSSFRSTSSIDMNVNINPTVNISEMFS